MKLYALACAAVVAAVPASTQEAPLDIKLHLGHPVYHESEQKAGVARALSVAPRSDMARA